MSEARIFHDYHLPNGVGLATNPSNSDSENKSISEILEGLKTNSNDEFVRLIDQYEKSLTAGLDFDAHHYRSLSYYQKMYSLLNPLATPSVRWQVGNDEVYMGQREPLKPSTDDKANNAVHTEDMTDMTRDELKAHLENQDLKVDARLGKFEQRVSDGLTDMNHSLQLLDKDLAGLRGLKGTIILNSVLSVIAVVGIVIGVMAYGTSSFDSGRDTAQLLQEVRQQSFENKQMLEQIKANQTPSNK